MSRLGPPLSRSFYDRPTLRVARDLLGCVLHHRGDDAPSAGVIVEVEAYLGPLDRAAHSFGKRRTPRNEVMYGPSGHAYVYFTYGMHFCVNAVTRGEGIPQAVLLRAVRPFAGLEGMRARRRPDAADYELARGPGNLCRAFGIDRSQNGVDLTSRRSPLTIREGEPLLRARVGRSPRIGIPSAGEFVERPWRFFLKDEPAVSGRRRGGRTAV